MRNFPPKNRRSGNQHGTCLRGHSILYQRVYRDYPRNSRSVIKYFSGEEGSLSEIYFEGSDDDLGMEDEDPYDSMSPLYQSDDEGITP